MSQTRKERQREKRRNEGYRPLEIWLPQDMITKLDAMKTGEVSSSGAVIMALVEEDLNLGHSLFGRREAIYGKRDQKASNRVNDMQRSTH